MAGFTLYSTGADWDVLYEDGWPSQFGRYRLEGFLESGDRPLDLLVDIEKRSLLWTFIGEHRGYDTDAGYFVAEYHTERDDLFQGFETALRSLQRSDNWTIPQSDDLRWNAGFQLATLSPDLPGLTDEERQRLFEHLRTGDSPLEFWMADYRSALQAVRALYEESIPCTVAIADEQHADVPDDVDLMLRPTGETDFEPVSNVTGTALEESTAGNDATGIADGGRPVVGQWRQWEGESVVAPLAGGVLCGLLGLALYSFFDAGLIHPITGLATIGGFLGAVLTFPGLAAMVDGDTADEDARTIIGLSRATIQTHQSLALPAVTAGTVLGFIYPNLFRTSGALIDTPWIFGPVSELVAGLLSVLLFTLVLMVGTWCIAYWLSDGEQLIDREMSGALVGGYAVYGLMLLLATGFASSVWYQLLPAL